MPRPGDWDAIGLGGDPTPGDPERIGALADGFQKMGTKAREIITAIEAVMNKNDDSVFVGDTAEALRGKVDGRLRGHVEDVASAFETSAAALREWRGVVVEQQAKADAALNAGRGLAEDDPEREVQKNAAQAAGEHQSEQASTYAGRINGVSDIQLPISDCEAFWEAFKWLAIILIIPALIFGGPIALLALGVNLALFIKTVVDVAKGDASFLDLFLAGLGLIAPTTKALPIFSIVKAIGKGIGAGVKGIANTFKNVFSKDFLFNGLLTGLKSMPMLATIAIKETGLFVVKNLRNFPIAAGNFGGNFGKIALNGLHDLGVSIGKMPAAIGRGFSAFGKGVGTFLVNSGKFVDAHFGNLQWTRIFLPVAGDEIRAFKALGMSDFAAFTQALKVGVIGRGVFAKDVFGLPTVAGIGRGVSQIPIETGGGHVVPKNSFLQSLITPEVRIPAIHVEGLTSATGAGFKGGQVFTAIDDINVNLGNVKAGDFGISVTPTTTITPGGVHLPGSAGTNLPTVGIGTSIPSPHVGTPQLPTTPTAGLPTPQVGTAVLPIHVGTNGMPAPVHIETPTLGSVGVGSVPQPAQLGTPNIGSQAFGNITTANVGGGAVGSGVHVNGINIQPPAALNNAGSLHAPAPPPAAGLSDLSGSAIRTNPPSVSTHFGHQIGDGAANGFQANRFTAGIDEILHSATGGTFSGTHAFTPPAVDRINAALDLLHNPGSTTQGVTPPSVQTPKPGSADVTTNVNLGSADLKTPPPTAKVDNPGLAGTQNAPAVPTVNVQPINLPQRAADLHVQPTTVHTGGQNGTNLPGTNLPGEAGLPALKVGDQPLPTHTGTTDPGQAGVPAPHAQGGQNLDTQLVPIRPQPAPPVHNPGYTLAKGADIGTSGIGTNTLASRAEIPLNGLPDRPGAYVVVERTEGGVSTFTLYGGGPDGRMDVLAGGNIRFTDTATGNTLRFDSSGLKLDGGLRLTKTDGILRDTDQVLVKGPGGELRITSLTGDAVPGGLKVRQLDGGGVQLTDPKGGTVHYNAQGKLESQSVSAAWDSDLAAKAGAFRKPGDTDAAVGATMDDFAQVQRAQANFDTAAHNADLHGHRIDGPSTGPSVGEQVHLDLRAAQADLSAAKASFAGKHGMDADGIQQQLDDVLMDSLKQRPRLVGGGRGGAMDLPGGGGSKFELNGGQVSFTGPKADDLTATLNGRALTIVETVDGQVVHTWNYSLGFGGRANQVGESFPLHGGLFDGRPITLEGRMGSFDNAVIGDPHGAPVPVKVTDDGFVVASGDGPLVYTKAGDFQGAGPSAAGHLPAPVPPPHLTGDALTRWNAQVDISRTHLTAAAGDKAVENLMKDVAGGSFTSKRGFGGYVNPQALEDGTLIAKVHAFETVAKDLTFRGPENDVTLYRGVSMDPGSATADVFVERLPVSTSSTPKFQQEWAKNGALSNRVVFEIDVPAGHGKLAMSYPDGYTPGATEARAWNQDQFEVTLSPTNLVRTGPNRLENGMTIVPVRAEQIPPARYDEVITAKWPGMSSETAFGDFVKAFETGSLRQFPDLGTVTSKSVLSTDGLTSTTIVSKPGFADDMTITVLRDPRADSVRVTISSDGVTKFDRSWSGTDFKHLATDLRGNVLHNNEQFVNLPQPSKWQGADSTPMPDVKGKGKAVETRSLDQTWADELAAKSDVFRRFGDLDAIVNARMDDFREVQVARANVKSAFEEVAQHGHRLDGSSLDDLTVGDQASRGLRAAENDLQTATTSFEAKHTMSVDGIQQQLDDLTTDSLKDRPRLLGAAGKEFPVPQGGAAFSFDGTHATFTGARAGEYSGVLDGRTLKVFQTSADGNNLRTLTYEINRLGRPMLTHDELVLKGGALDGRRLVTQIELGLPENALIPDVDGGKLAVGWSKGEFKVPSPTGPQFYDRAGNFLRAEPGIAGSLPPAVPAAGVHVDDLTRWSAQADISRTHLAAAGVYPEVRRMMQSVYEGAFTSKRGYGGYVDPAVLRGAGEEILSDAVHRFNRIADDLLGEGPIGSTTVYRGLAMDPAAANATHFVERLPISTSSNWEFQPQWARGADPGKRVVLQIDVPPGHGKLAMSYPDGYTPKPHEAPGLNQGQFEVTLSPTVLKRTGEPFHKDGLTVVPVRAEQIPSDQIDDLIGERWPGLDSGEAFDDFARAFDQANLRKFSNLSDATASSKGRGNLNEITVSKPGLDGELKITVTRDPDADSVRVTVDVNGSTKFDRAWSRDEFANIATDLKAGTLHDNDLFVALPKPAEWNRQQPLSAQWEQDLAGKSAVVRRPGDSDAMVDVKLEDVSRLKQTEMNLRTAELNFQLHRGRTDGPAADLPIGEQVRIDLDSARADLDAAKAGFKRKHDLDFDDVRAELDSVVKRPKLDGAGRSFEVPGGGVSYQVDGATVSFTGSRADSFTGSVNGREVTVTELAAGGDVVRSWTFRMGFGRPNLTGQTFHLADGPLAGGTGSAYGMAGRLDGVVDHAGGSFPVKLSGDDLVIAAPGGLFRYDRAGTFHGIVAHIGGDLGRPIPPPGLTGDALTRWNAQAELSRAHLGEAGTSKAVENLMKDVMGGAFTSKRGYEGYVNPGALDGGGLVSKVKNFHTVTQDLLTKGPADNITVYRGMSMDPAAMRADSFVERLPISTSSTLKFQDEWARNGVLSNRVVFEIDVPPAHNKLAMSYPEGYRPGAGEAKAWNQDQFEVTLAPTTLVRTGEPPRVENGLTIIPVRAEQIPLSRYDEVITAQWQGLGSETAFDDFGKAFSADGLRKFDGMADVTVHSTKSTDGLVNTIVVSKPGVGEQLVITVTRDVEADSVRVTTHQLHSDDLIFDQTWSRTGFSHIATDLRGGVLHNNEQFLGRIEPASWKPAPEAQPLGQVWDAENAARVDVLRKTDGTVVKADSNGERFALVGTTERIVVRDPDGALHLVGAGADDFAIRALDDGGFRVYDDNGFAQRYGADGTHLGDGRSVVNGDGLRGDRFVEVDAGGGARLVDVQGRPIAGTTTDLLPDGGFRTTGANGHTQRFGPTGVHVTDGLALSDRLNLHPTLYAEPNPAGGLRVLDADGTPVPNTHATQLPNGKTMVVDDTLRDVQWFGADGIRTGSGVQVAHADFPNPVYRYRTDSGALHLVDDLGHRLPHQIDVLPNNTFRVTDQAGIARTFDEAGAALDRRIPLRQPAAGPKERLVVVHHADNTLQLRTGADVPVGHRVDLLANGGFRVGDDGGFRLYDADGAFVTRGHAMTLPGETGFLEITGTTARRVDSDYQPLPGREVTFDLEAGEFTVARTTGGHDVFDLRGGLVREVTDIRPNALEGGLTRVVRQPDGSVRWIDANGVPMRRPHVVTVSDAGVVRLQINLPGMARHGEFHSFSRTGDLLQQGFPVVRNGEPTRFSYVVDHAAGTWSRVGDDATGAFLHGKVDVTGIGNGRIKLMSSTGNPVEVFERRWLPDGSLLDSFRRTDTLGFGRFDRSSSWVSYAQDGVTTTGWGKRHFDTTGAGWTDVHNGRTIREYREGLQKYDTSTGHVLATRNGDDWHWYRFDDRATLIADGRRVRETIGDGWTDTLTRTVDDVEVTEVAQRKWGNWHGTSSAGQYQEFTLVRTADGVLERPGTWDQLSRQGRESGGSRAVTGDGVLSVVRQGEQRPPVWVREMIYGNQRPVGQAAHLADDARFQIFRWEQTGPDAGHGIRYVGNDSSVVDVALDGSFVRSTAKLHDGTTLKVGDHATPPTVAHPRGGTAWEAGGQRGWRVPAGDRWSDVTQLDGAWVTVREGFPGGLVREFPEPRNRNVWFERDAHGNLTGLSYKAPGTAGDGRRYVVATGAADSSNWRWRELDARGTAIPGREGDRLFFRGSSDDTLSWDDSFRDFDAAGNLIRDRRMLDGGRYVESWKLPNQHWRSGEFDKLGARVPGSQDLVRMWSTGTDWQQGWVHGSDHFADVRPGIGGAGDDIVREVPLHLSDSPLRVREYHLDGAGRPDRAQWKEFDHGAVVRERKLSGTNYLETENWRGQWKLYDSDGRVIGERGHDGLVFELRGERLTLTGSEYDFRGALTEMRGWGRRLREPQRMPFLLDSDWTLGKGSTLVPDGNPGWREAAYAPLWKSIGQKAMIEFGQEFVLEFTANLIVNAIIADAQGRSFTGKDALKALMNAGVSATIKTGMSSALNDSKLGGALRQFRQEQVNLDAGKHLNRRPLNHDRLWNNEWTGNESATRWRGGTYDFGFNFGPSLLSGFVNGTMNASIFGITDADGNSVKLSGWDAVGDGAINAVATLTTGVSTALVKTIGTSFGGSRFFHRQGFADFWLQIPFRVFEKSIQGVFLTNAIRASINPGWYASNEPVGGSSSLLVLPSSVTVPALQTTGSGLVLPPGVQATTGGQGAR